MIRFALLSCLLLAGCSSHSLRSDYYETQFRAQQALEGRTKAFDRLAQLQVDWRARSDPRWYCRHLPGAEKRHSRAVFIADRAERMVRSRDAVLSQRELTEVMLNAFVDLESEYDSLVDLLVANEAPVGVLSTVAEQKYLIRRMANSIVLMGQVDMANAVEAADLFGRDVERFQNLLGASINGDEELGIDPPEDPQVEDALAQIEELFTGYVADSAPGMLDSVAYRHDAWLALKEMDELGDGRKVKATQDEGTGSEEEAAGDAGEEGAGVEGAAATDEGEDAPAGEPGEDVMGNGEGGEEPAGGTDADASRDEAADESVMDESMADEPAMDEAGEQSPADADPGSASEDEQAF
jgi:hypothetical protein